MPAFFPERIHVQGLATYTLGRVQGQAHVQVETPFPVEAYQGLGDRVEGQGVDGLQLSQAIHEIEPSLPVIVYTGTSLELDHAEGLPFGIRRVLAKPVAYRDLAEALQSALVEGEPTPEAS